MSLTHPAAPDPEPAETSGLRSTPARIYRSLLRLTVFAGITFFFWWLFARLLSPFAEGLITSIFSLGLAVLISTAGMMQLYESQPFYAVGLFANRTGAHHLGVGLALGAGAALPIIALQWACGWVRIERAPFPPGGALTTVFWFVVLFTGATGEELLFRGYGFQNLIRAFGPWFSILSTSILFGLGHDANPAFSRVAMVNTVLFGLVFGYGYWRTRDLWLPLGMHFAWNLTLAAAGANISGLKIKLLGLSVVSAGSPLWSGADYGPEGSLLTTFVLATAGVILWRAPLGRQDGGILAGRP